MNPKKILSQEEKQYFLSLKRTDITHQLLQDLFADKYDTKTNKIIPCKFNTYDEFDLKSTEYFNKEDVHTNCGLFIFNKFIIEKSFSNLVGYCNKPLDKKELGRIKGIIDTKGISKENFKSLINTYNHYYPNDTLTISKAYKYVDTLFSVKRDIKDPDKLEKVKEVELNSMEKIECLKNLLRYFVQCDNFVSIPEELMNFYGLTLKEYNNALENAKTSSDPELKALLDRFNAKLEFAFNEEQNRIDKLLNYINNGIYINGEFVDFNLYFFYSEFGIDYKGMSSTLSKHLKPGEVKKIRDWFKSKFNFQRIYKPEEEEELIKSINFSNSNGELTYDQKKIITSYIISQGWPLGTVIYSDMIQSVLNGYLDLESLNNSVGKHI